MKKILVTGATGLLGTSLVPYLRRRHYQVRGVANSRKSDYNADRTNPENISSILHDFNPDIIVNLAALANVDECESNPHLAYLLNAKIVENICVSIKQLDNSCHLLQLSTDQNYDGVGPKLETENYVSNYYGMSKLAGEFAAMTVSSTILRTNFVGKSLCKNRLSFTDWLYQSLSLRKPVNIFSDVFFSPLSISILCNSLEQCILRRPQGVFNLGSRNGISKADFALSFAHVIGIPADCFSIARLSDASLLARRPSDMRMDSSLFEHCMDFQLPTTADVISSVASEYL